MFWTNSVRRCVRMPAWRYTSHLSSGTAFVVGVDGSPPPRHSSECAHHPHERLENPEYTSSKKWLSSSMAGKFGSVLFRYKKVLALKGSRKDFILQCLAFRYSGAFHGDESLNCLLLLGLWRMRVLRRCLAATRTRHLARAEGNDV